jgi:rhodanese-related sulfurtransferase
MTGMDYFKAKQEATISPRGLFEIQQHAPASVLVVDVRIGPVPSRIRGAVAIPQTEIIPRMDELPKDKLLVLYCWETWCSLATKAAIPLLESGFKVKEMYGGIAAWESLKLPTDAEGSPKGTIECAC